MHNIYPMNVNALYMHHNDRAYKTNPTFTKKEKNKHKVSVETK